MIVLLAFTESQGIALSKSVSGPITESGDEKGKPEQSKTNHAALPAIAPQPKPKPGQENKEASRYETDCKSPKSREEADLCEQRRMADAAKNAVTVAIKQLHRTNVEVGILIGTLLIGFFSAGAAAAAVIISWKASKQELRAYVSGAARHIFSFTKDTIATAKFAVKNHGQTPAHNLKTHGLIDIFPYPLPDDFLFPETDTTRGSTSALFPQVEVSGDAAATRKFTADEIKRVIDGKARVYVFGAISYRDIFGAHQMTRFACSVRALPQGLESLTTGYPKGDLHLDFETTKQHNEAT